MPGAIREKGTSCHWCHPRDKVILELLSLLAWSVQLRIVYCHAGMWHQVSRLEDLAEDNKLRITLFLGRVNNLAAHDLQGKVMRRKRGFESSSHARIKAKACRTDDDCIRWIHDRVAHRTNGSPKTQDAARNEKMINPFSWSYGGLALLTSHEMDDHERETVNLNQFD